MPFESKKSQRLADVFSGSPRTTPEIPCPLLPRSDEGGSPGHRSRDTKTLAHTCPSTRPGKVGSVAGSASLQGQDRAGESPKAPWSLPCSPPSPSLLPRPPSLPTNTTDVPTNSRKSWCQPDLCVKDQDPRRGESHSLTPAITN